MAWDFGVNGFDVEDSAASDDDDEIWIALKEETRMKKVSGKPLRVSRRDFVQNCATGVAGLVARQMAKFGSWANFGVRDALALSAQSRHFHALKPN